MHLLTTFAITSIILLVLFEIYTLTMFETHSRYLISISILRRYMKLGRISKKVFKSTLEEVLLEKPIYKLFLAANLLSIVFYISFLPAGIPALTLLIYIQSMVVERILVNGSGFAPLITLLLRKLFTLTILIASIIYLIGGLT